MAVRFNNLTIGVFLNVSIYLLGEETIDSFAIPRSIIKS
jgi:hypothetical protein